jgi:hypothetical protein
MFTCLNNEKHFFFLKKKQVDRRYQQITDWFENEHTTENDSNKTQESKMKHDVRCFLKQKMKKKNHQQR